MALSLSSSFNDGDYLGNDHILSAAYGFGCAGGNQSPHSYPGTLGNRPIAVQFHAGSHYVALRLLEGYLPKEKLKPGARGRHLSLDGTLGSD